jgi:hypothetical protein
MPEYTVKQGDCLSSIAEKHGFTPDKIWDHRKNSQLKEKRKDPNFLQPGDVVHMPDKEKKEEFGDTDQRHKFKRRGVPEKFNYEIIVDIQVDPEDLEIADDRFTLFSTDGPRTYERTLTIEDDLIPDDDFATLRYTNLNPNLSYTLEVDPGGSGTPYELFTDVAYPDLKKAEEQEGFLEPDENEEPEQDWFNDEMDEFDIFDEVDVDFEVEEEPENEDEFLIRDEADE